MSVSATLFVVVALMVSFRVAVLRGFDHTIGPDSWGRFSFAIGAALTDTVYGIPGYVIDTRVESFLAAHGLTGDHEVLAKLGLNFPENLRNATLLNSVIEQAAGLNYPPPPPLRGASGDDLGMVDFVELSFRLFGYSVLGFTLTYFFVLAAEVSAFLLAFRNRPSALYVLVSWVAAHAAVLASGLFDFDWGLGSVTDPRWLSALAILPALHVGLLMLRSERPSGPAVGMVGIQTLCAAFAISIRASAGWVVLAILVLGVFIGIGVTRRYVTGWRDAHVTGWRDAALPFWPACVFLAGLIGYAVVCLHNLNPEYAKKGDIDHHAVWHSILYSLQNFNPDWNSRFGWLAPGAAGDEMPWVAAENYRAWHPPATPDPELYLNGHLTLEGLEHYARAVVFEIAHKDPSFFITTFLYYKPRVMVGEFAKLVVSLDRIPIIALAVFSGAILWLVVLLSGCKSERDHLFYLNIVLTGGLFVSISPNILTVATAQVLGDAFLMLVTVSTSWGIWCLAVVARPLRNIISVGAHAAATSLKRPRW